MKATYIHNLEPEKMAAILARYSRSNEGIDALTEKFRDATPDSIFKMVDYGHASIGGLTGGVAIAIDGISMLLAAKLFEFAQMADGQESSTRYIKLGVESLPDPQNLGIPAELAEEWKQLCAMGFELYDISLELLNEHAANHPDSLRFPEAAQTNEKLKDRLIKNYGLDRARYFLPLATKTNVAIVATARIWADILKLVDSLAWTEATDAASLIRNALKAASPNLVRHSYADTASINFVNEAMSEGQCIPDQVGRISTSCKCQVQVFTPSGAYVIYEPDPRVNLEWRKNRYSHTGIALKRQTVTVCWDRMAIAEMRDLNRHRTGFRFSDWSPRGFYLPEETTAILMANGHWEKVQTFLDLYSSLVQDLHSSVHIGLQCYAYFLGTQIAFEHTQMADKFLYEVELRTGMGAHFKYAEHVKQAADLYFEKHPEVRDYIKIGEAEPE